MNEDKKEAKLLVCYDCEEESSDTDLLAMFNKDSKILCPVCDGDMDDSENMNKEVEVDATQLQPSATTYNVDEIKVIVSGVNKGFSIGDLEEERDKLSIEWGVVPKEILFELLMCSSLPPGSSDTFPAIVAYTLKEEKETQDEDT